MSDRLTTIKSTRFFHPKFFGAALFLVIVLAKIWVVLGMGIGEGMLGQGIGQDLAHVFVYVFGAICFLAVSGWNALVDPEFPHTLFMVIAPFNLLVNAFLLQLIPAMIIHRRRSIRSHPLPIHP